jgi:membrane-associated protease RseP (regulator of RpoE activity)
MMGIGLSDFNEGIAKQAGVPVSSGIRLDSTAPGMGAEAAGLQKGDVLEEIDGQPITDYASLTNALQGRAAGDRVMVGYYRGPERRSVSMELSRRPLPTIIWDPVELSRAVASQYAETCQALRDFFADVSEAEASHRPAAAEWSAREVLAHLIHSERGFQNNVGEMVTGAESVYDDYGENLLARVEATVAVYPTIADLMAAYEHSTDETVELLAHLPEEATRRKSSYWRLALIALDNPFHFRGHLEQMGDAVRSARQSPDGDSRPGV